MGGGAEKQHNLVAGGEQLRGVSAVLGFLRDQVPVGEGEAGEVGDDGNPVAHGRTALQPDPPHRVPDSGENDRVCRLETLLIVLERHPPGAADSRHEEAPAQPAPGDAQ